MEDNQELLIEATDKAKKYLNTIPKKELVEFTASQLHEIWKNTTYIRDENGNILLDENGEKKQVEKWKKLDSNESIEEKKYVDYILKNPKARALPFIRVNDDGSVSINIAKMDYKHLSPHWKKENHEAAEVAVTYVLDNYLYLKDEVHRKIVVRCIGSGIHLLWLNRPANAYAKETELGQDYRNLSRDEQLKDERHIYIAEKAVDYICKDYGIDKKIEEIFSECKKAGRVL